MKIVKLLYRLVMPGGFLLLLTFSLIRLQVLALSEQSYTRWYPCVVLAVGLLLSAFFHRSRLFFALLVISLGSTALAWPQVFPESGRAAAFSAIAILMPLNLLALCFLRDRGIISPMGKSYFIVLGGEALAVILLAQPQFTRIGSSLDYQFLPPFVSEWSHLPQVGLAAFLAGAVVMIVCLARRYNVIRNGLLWMLIASFVALRAGGASHVASAYFAAGALALLIAVLETSYSMAYHDELTRLPGRRALNEALLKLGDIYAVAMVDVDHFKKFNDTYGHEAGDEALRMVASKLAHVTGGGRAYRYGGEEFAVLFPGKPAEEAFTYLDRMRRLIEQSPFVVRGKDRRRKGRGRPAKNGGKVQTRVTVSVGIAARCGEKLEVEEVLRTADKALYRAKSRGRNCTVTVRPSTAPKPETSRMRILQVE